MQQPAITANRAVAQASGPIPIENAGADTWDRGQNRYFRHVEVEKPPRRHRDHRDHRQNPNDCQQHRPGPFPLCSESVDNGDDANRLAPQRGLRLTVQP